jgi:phosphate transport system ATP-binding protein
MRLNALTVYDGKKDSMNIIAQVRRLTITIAGRKIVDDVTLDIPTRQITVLIGRSGSGKTTFLRAFNRLNEEFDDCYTEGKIALALNDNPDDFISVKALSLSELRLQVGMVFQTPNVLPISIWRNVALPLEKLTDCSKEEIDRRVEASLKDVGLWSEVNDRLHQPADTLSGGQQQRLCLARTLALQPKILLLDEPTASLDVLASRDIERLLVKLSEKYTIIMVSHSLSQARRLAQHLFVFDSGRLVKNIHHQEDLNEDNLKALMELF